MGNSLPSKKWAVTVELYRCDWPEVLIAEYVDLRCACALRSTYVHVLVSNVYETKQIV